jgi:signal transduction histidine kinase
MTPMPTSPNSQAKGRWTALAVLLLALAATGFGVWRELAITQRDEKIIWSENFNRLQPILTPLISQHFETMRDQAKATLRRENYSETSWQDFLTATEWQSRFPGMVEIGWAEFSESNCIVKFSASSSSTGSLPVSFDLNRNAIVRETVQKCADAAYGIGSKEISLGQGTNAQRVIVGLLPLPKHDMRPASASENRVNLAGFVFFALDQKIYFNAAQPLFKNLPFDLRLLGTDEAAPRRTATVRPFTNGGISGEWRFVATMKATPASASAPQWIVGCGGIALSLLLYFLFTTQARLRWQAESANKTILEREAEILSLNRDLEQKVSQRTVELNVALAKEKELNRLKGNFISMVTHEIRTPLALILGSSEILSRYLERLTPEKRTEHLKTIDASVHRMSGLLEDVLLFSKAEAGRMEFNPTELDLKKFCATLTDELLSATSRRCPIELACDIAEPARADEKLLRHVLSNLISNAAKYSPPGTPVKFSVTRDGGEAIFIVQDRGMGIPEDDRKRLFTPFYRGKNVATIQGTGLGLVIVKLCAERHGGSVSVDSAENLGTTVSVRLPLFSPAHTEFVRRISQDEK